MARGKAKSGRSGSREVGLGDQLRDAIDRSRRTYSDLASEAGIDASQILRFASGERDIRVETAGRLCAVLGLHLAETSRGRGRPAARKSDRADFEGEAFDPAFPIESDTDK
jgi:transcriptional regulator with XRE-family HTH domain